MAEKTPEELFQERCCEPGIVIAGEDVIYDGEAAHFDMPAKKRVRFPPGWKSPFGSEDDD